MTPVPTDMSYNASTVSQGLGSSSEPISSPKVSVDEVESSDHTKSSRRLTLSTSECSDSQVIMKPIANLDTQTGQTTPILLDNAGHLNNHERHYELLRKLLEDAQCEQSVENFTHFQKATVRPPITNKTLQELDFENLIGNLKLRHDMNFDLDLHLKPNLTDGKGSKKSDKHDRYWQAVTVEIDLLAILPSLWSRKTALPQAEIKTAMKQCQKRLPLMFNTIREILHNLVPEDDQSNTDSLLDVDVIMMEIEMGVCDFIRIAESLGSLLQKHCSPMRDCMIDNMVNLMRDGTARQISAGLRELFNTLEIMKLDVANHQIRQMRAPLIDTCISFEQKYQKDRITAEKFRIQPSFEWFQNACQDSLANQERMGAVISQVYTSNQPFAAFVRCFVHDIIEMILSPESSVSLPATFYLDGPRIQGIAREIMQELQTQICYEVFQECYEEEVYKSWQDHYLEKLFKDRYIAIARGCGDVRDLIPNLAVEIAYQVHKYSDNPNASMNPRVIEEAELLLERLAPHPCNGSYLEILDEMVPQLIERVYRLGLQYMTTSAWDIIHFLAPSSSPGPKLQQSPLRSTVVPMACAPFTTDITAPPVHDPLLSVVNKLTHVAILHWRTWAPLVYMPIKDIHKLEAPAEE